MEHEGSTRVNISLDTLRAELAQLELRIVDRLTGALDKKADQAHVDGIEGRVAGLELTRAEQVHLPKEISEARDRITKLERFRYAVPSISALSLLVAIALAASQYLIR